MTDSEKTATAQALLDDLIRWWVHQRSFHRKQLRLFKTKASYSNRVGSQVGYREALMIGGYNLDVLFTLRHALKSDRGQR